MENWRRGLSEMHRSKQQGASIRLGEDIITEILLRLPVNSVVNFKSVSKLWLTIVSSKRFRKNHACRRHNRAAARCLFFKFDKSDFLGLLPIDSKFKPEITFSVPLLEWPNGYGKPQITFSVPLVKRPNVDEFMSLTCISSCNGLLLVKSVRSAYIDFAFSHDHLYFVCNPTTRECKLLPGIPLHISQSEYVYASLAFDPYESVNYKVIFLLRVHGSRNKFQLEVYSSTTGNCKPPVTNMLVGDFNYNDNCGIFCNGAIHWLSSDAILIVYFNVHTECIKELRTPMLGRKIHYFGESRGHLLLVNSDERYKGSVIDVYELERDYSGWFLKYQVELASIASVLPQLVYPLMHYGTFMSIFWDEEDDDDSTMVLLACNEWVEYNFKKKSAGRLCEFVPPELFADLNPWTYGFNTYQFIPTLACL